MERARLRRQLAAEFDTDAVRTVVRAAGDLADSGQLAADAGYDLTADLVVDHLQDAPAGFTLVERWNWWVGSLELAYGHDYHQFRVRTVE